MNEPNYREEYERLRDAVKFALDVEQDGTPSAHRRAIMELEHAISECDEEYEGDQE